MTRTFWLSFCDDDRPQGQQFLGVCVVDVTTTDADEALADIAMRFPQAKDGAEWIAAASKKAWREGCNPGGEMASADITEALAYAPVPVPRNRLMSFADLEALDLQPATQSDIECGECNR